MAEETRLTYQVALFTSTSDVVALIVRDHENQPSISSLSKRLVDSNFFPHALPVWVTYVILNLGMAVVKNEAFVYLIGMPNEVKFLEIFLYWYCKIISFSIKVRFSFIEKEIDTSYKSFFAFFPSKNLTFTGFTAGSVWGSYVIFLPINDVNVIKNMF